MVSERVEKRVTLPVMLLVFAGVLGMASLAVGVYVGYRGDEIAGVGGPVSQEFAGATRLLWALVGATVLCGIGGVVAAVSKRGGVGASVVLAVVLLVSGVVLSAVALPLLAVSVVGLVWLVIASAKTTQVAS